MPAGRRRGVLGPVVAADTRLRRVSAWSTRGYSSDPVARQARPAGKLTGDVIRTWETAASRGGACLGRQLAYTEQAGQWTVWSDRANPYPPIASSLGRPKPNGSGATQPIIRDGPPARDGGPCFTGGRSWQAPRNRTGRNPPHWPCSATSSRPNGANTSPANITRRPSLRRRAGDVSGAGSTRLRWPSHRGTDSRHDSCAAAR